MIAFLVFIAVVAVVGYFVWRKHKNDTVNVTVTTSGVKVTDSMPKSNTAVANTIATTGVTTVAANTLTAPAANTK